VQAGQCWAGRGCSRQTESECLTGAYVLYLLTPQDQLEGLECGVHCLMQLLVLAAEFVARVSRACSLGALGNPLGLALTYAIDQLTEDTCIIVVQS
jgi:hypothetical protein